MTLVISAVHVLAVPVTEPVVPVIVVISFVLSLYNSIVYAVPGLAVVIVPEIVKGESVSSLLQTINVASVNVANGAPLISIVVDVAVAFGLVVLVAVTGIGPRLNVVVMLPILILCISVVALAVLYKYAGNVQVLEDVPVIVPVTVVKIPLTVGAGSTN